MSEINWTMKTPPFGVWAYSVEEGLFMIERKTETNYLETLRVCRFEKNKIDTGTRYTVFVRGPFIYPLPDPTKGVQ